MRRHTLALDESKKINSKRNEKLIFATKRLSITDKMRGLLLLGVVVFYTTSLNVGSANAEFVNDFFKAVGESVSGNMICSPISAELTVIAAGLGATGPTYKQIQQVLLRTDKDGDQRIKTFMEELTSYKEIELRMATKVFVASGYSLKRKFMQLIQAVFKSSVQKINFRSPFKASRWINDWCAAHTNNRIKQLVTPADVDPSSAVMLVNAIYFKGAWAKPIFANQTTQRDFYVDGKTMVQVPTMTIDGMYASGSLPELDAKFFELPYQTHDAAHAVSMYIIVPNQVDGIIELKKNLDKITIDMLRENADIDYTLIFLPKFKIESSLELRNSLSKMGLTEMFSRSATFSEIVENENLQISKVIQKAFLEVNEQGSEAAVVTGMDMVPRTKPYIFNVDRPFISMVVTQSKITIFSAIITDPRN